MDQGDCTAFVLGGGGRYGAVEVGMLAGLLEADITPDLIVGTSIGAVNGSVLASDPTLGGVARLETMWQEMAASSSRAEWSRSARNLMRLRPALNTGDRLRHWLESTLDVTTFEELTVPFQCVAASIQQAAERWFSSGPLVPAVMASSAVPGLFPPVRIGDEHHYDGGLVNSVPVDRALRIGADRVFVLQVGRLEAPLRPPARIHEAALVAFEISRRHRFAATMSEVAQLDVEVHVLPSGSPVQYDDARQMRMTDFSDSEQLIDGAARATRDYLAANGLAAEHDHGQSGEGSR